jgi:hypothetical protein
MDSMEQEYKDWIALLDRTGNNDLLKDPYNVWVEAWSLALLRAKKDPNNSGSNTFQA